MDFLPVQKEITTNTNLCPITINQMVDNYQPSSRQLSTKQPTIVGYKNEKGEIGMEWELSCVLLGRKR